MLVRRRSLVVGLAGSFIAACAGPASPAPTPKPLPSPSPVPTSVPTSPAATALATATPESTATAVPQPTATPSSQVPLNVRLWNGAAEVQLDGRTIAPGSITVERGHHQLAALVNDDVVSLADAPPDGGAVDLVVPPPLASLAIMVENQADARPQTGLTSADVVYEVLAEGGITRFVALYLTGDAPVVGPVRSLRHYFAFFAADYGADVVHIGASPEGFAWRDAMHMGHLDETFGDPGVWRVSSRPPPHNAYTATEPDRGFLQDRGNQQNHSWGPLLFSDQAPRGPAAAENIELQFRPWAYQVNYAWDANVGRYLRSMEGAPHLDAQSGEQMAPATVVVQFAEVDPIPNDPKYRLDINLVGANGQLVVFSDGTRREGTWSKPAPKSSSIWLDDKGDPLVIPHGPVWVEVVPLESPVRVS